MSSLTECRAAGQALEQARKRRVVARARAISAVRAACAAGVPEAAVARAVGVTRTTVRAWRKGE